MRKRSCVLPVWLTVFAFSSPAFYVLFRVNKPEIFSLAELGGKVVGAAGCSIVVWFFYGVFCLIAPPLKKESAEEKPEASAGQSSHGQ